MNSKQKKIIINIEGHKDLNWKLYLENQFKKIKSNNIEINCTNLEFSCTDIVDLIDIARQYDSNIVSFCSSSSKTIISSKSLGYRAQLIMEDDSNNTLKINDKNQIFGKTHFHQGTVRSGEYHDISGNLLILGDVNPGAIVSADENIMIWGRLLGIAPAAVRLTTTFQRRGPEQTWDMPEKERAESLSPRRHPP